MRARLSPIRAPRVSDSILTVEERRGAMTSPTLSLIISTRGRTHELAKLLRSLSLQTMADFETIIVDQNVDNRLCPILAEAPTSLRLRHVRTPHVTGLSRGRNHGWRLAQGSIVAFPDDDCWFPPTLLERAVNGLDSLDADVVCGRAADETGRSINARFEKDAQWVRRDNIWTTQIEWMVFFRKAVLEKTAGYDESLGVGAETPWGAYEGPDLLLRALQVGARIYYDPELIGHHRELPITKPDADLVRKCRSYARGMGFVMNKHSFRAHVAAKWVLRPLLNAGLRAVFLEKDRAWFHLNVALGRAEGYGRRVLLSAADYPPPGHHQNVSHHSV